MHDPCPLSERDQQCIYFEKRQSFYEYVSIQRVHFNEETYIQQIVSRMRNVFEWRKFLERENI